MIKRILVHSPFILATGIAAFVHSTWALATLFSGEMPDPASAPLAFAYWLLPAALIAFALDVGQIVTSAEIRSGKLTAAKAWTFGTFALATYYLQWTYIVHHMPDLALGAGIRSAWVPAILVMRDAAIWIVPALLPASTLLYTLSGAQEKRADVRRELRERSFDYDTDEIEPIYQEKASFLSVCPHGCGFRREYDSEKKAQNALNGHMRHCTENPANKVVVE